MTLNSLTIKFVNIMGLTNRITEMIKAIETEYKGYRFRSRLEARWAVFFDACNAKWEYEPEGFQLPSGKYYLPDFLIHNVDGRYCGDLWIEVKGKMTKEDADKIIEFNDNLRNPILIVTTIPTGKNIDDIYDFTSDYSYCSYKECWYDADPYNLQLIDGDWFGVGLYAAKGGGLYLDDANHNFYSEYAIDEILTFKAFEKARQARFEHGENPTPNKHNDLDDFGDLDFILPKKSLNEKLNELFEKARKQ